MLTCSTWILEIYISLLFFGTHHCQQPFVVGRLRFAKTGARGEKGSQEAQDTRPTSPEKH